LLFSRASSEASSGVVKVRDGLRLTVRRLGTKILHLCPCLAAIPISIRQLLVGFHCVRLKPIHRPRIGRRELRLHLTGAATGQNNEKSQGTNNRSNLEEHNVCDSFFAEMGYY